MSAHKNVVIYTRYSSDLQRPDSCADQEREVRAGLARLGIDATDAIILRDEAVSGTKTDRDGFQQLAQIVARREVAVLAVDDQSRLSRGGNAHAFITDLVYAGGRFISTGEGIDTHQEGWDLKVQVLQLHHGQTIRDLQHRVHRGQRGRVLDGGSAGDFPYGYEAYHLDADWQEQLSRRGPRPRKGVRVHETEAEWVRKVFGWFVAGKSIGGIARELTKLKAPKGRRASTQGWHPQQVRRLLTNGKYIGRWSWGATAIRRDSRGKKKQVAVPADQIVLQDRPELKIVDQAIWDKAAARLAKLNETFGQNSGQKRRGAKPNPAEEYPRSPLGGVLRCGTCRSKMWQHHSNSRRYYACPGAKKGLCDMTAQVPAEKAERALTGFLLDHLRGWPEWVADVYRRTRAAVQSAAERLPDDRTRDLRRLAELDRHIDNLVSALADGGVTSSSVMTRLKQLEQEKAAINHRLATTNDEADAIPLPDAEWVSARLAEWAERAAASESDSFLRHALQTVTAEAVIAPGKKRGFIRLHFRVNAWAALAAAMGAALRVAVRPPESSDEDTPPEFTLDLGEPTPMDRWAPQIAAWRAAGVTWTEIVRRTGMDLNRVLLACKRYTAAAESSAD